MLPQNMKIKLFDILHIETCNNYLQAFELIDCLFIEAEELRNNDF
jgi:hypothetical protein